MRVELKKRYYCDHCKKQGGSSGHMKRHEAGCTANPSRVCGVCRFAELKALPLAYLTVLARSKATWHESQVDGPAWGSLDAEAFKALEDAAGGCPACILATLRITNISHGDFNFKSAMAEVWKNVNEKQLASEYGY